MLLTRTALIRAGRGEEGHEYLVHGAGAQRTFIQDAWSHELMSHGMTIADQLDRALALKQSQQPAEGAKVLETALKWYPRSHLVMNNLAIARVALQDMDGALAAANQAADSWPRSKMCFGRPGDWNRNIRTRPQ